MPGTRWLRPVRSFPGGREQRFEASVASARRRMQWRVAGLAAVLALLPLLALARAPLGPGELLAWLLLPPLLMGVLVPSPAAGLSLTLAPVVLLLTMAPTFGLSLVVIARVAALELLLCTLGWLWGASRERSWRCAFLQRERLQLQLAQARQRAAGADAALREERGKLEDALDQKQRFFASAYHDLQQPLSTINLFCRVMARRIPGPENEAARRDLAVIERASRDIGAMFKGVRELWELGHYQPSIDDVNVALVAQEVINETTQFARDRGLQLRLRARRRSEACWGVSDRNLLKRALTNLVVNGLKYTDAGGVLVAYGVQGQRIRLDVFDTGLGIPEALHARIFEEHFQVHAGAQRRGGLGLGLAIVRRIEASLPEHRVGLRSQAGRGSHFWIELPRTEAPDGGETTWSTGTRDAALLRGRFIAVVDDQEDLLEGMLQTLGQVGAHARGARTLGQARELFEATARCPDLLITDFRLAEDKTGLDVIAAMREAYDWAPEIPVLVVSAEAMTPAWQAQLPQGAYVLQKPLEAGRLLATILAILSARRM